MAWHRWCLAFLLAFCSGSLIAGEPERGLTRIALGSFGEGNHSTWFRLLVEVNLTEQGFKVVSEKDQPEATLTGVIFCQNPMGAQPTGTFYPDGLVRLVMPDGRSAWWWKPTSGLGNHSAHPEATLLVRTLRQAIKDGTMLVEKKQN